MTAPVKIRASSAVARDIAQLKAERSAAEIRLGELEATWSDTLLNGTDKDAEKHEAEAAKQRRAIARANLRLPPLEDELTRAEAHEAAVALEEKQTQARAVVDEVVRTYPDKYRKLAAELVPLLRQFSEADRIAEEADVPGPNAVLRTIPGSYTPAQEQEYTVWVHPVEGERSDKPRPSVGMYNANGELVPTTIAEKTRLAQYRSVKRTRTIPAVRVHDRLLAYLPSLVRLPGVLPDEDAIWPPAPPRSASEAAAIGPGGVTTQPHPTGPLSPRKPKGN